MSAPQINREIATQLAEHYAAILQLLGEDTARQGLQQTPLRVARAMQELTRGYAEDARRQLIDAAFEEPCQQMIVVQDIPFYSMCEHHLLPFYGKVHVAYFPNRLITGLSKIARVADIYSHRLQVQERLTRQIKDCIAEALQPLGVMAVVQAEHMCMQMRGEEKQKAAITTIDFCGCFELPERRNEFLQILHNKTSVSY